MAATATSMHDDPMAGPSTGAGHLLGEGAFPMVLRGYDRAEVDAYVAGLRARIEELEATRSPQGVLRRAMEEVGERTGEILQRAQQSADDIAERARSEAEAQRVNARREAEATVRRAHERARELDSEIDVLWQERQRLLDDTRQIGAQLTQMAAAATERFPAADAVAEEAPHQDVAAPPVAPSPEEDATATTVMPAVAAPLAEDATGVLRKADPPPVSAGEPPAQDEPGGDDEPAEEDAPPREG